MSQMRNNYQMPQTQQRGCSNCGQPCQYAKTSAYETMNQAQLLNHINEVSFAVADVLLFLDTHPCDCNALSYCDEMISMRDEALKSYSQRFGPLTVDKTNMCEEVRWNWIMQPWPWENMLKGGCR